MKNLNIKLRMQKANTEFLKIETLTVTDLFLHNLHISLIITHHTLTDLFLHNLFIP